MKQYAAASTNPHAGSAPCFTSIPLFILSQPDAVENGAGGKALLPFWINIASGSGRRPSHMILAFGQLMVELDFNMGPVAVVLLTRGRMHAWHAAPAGLGFRHDNAV
ncbi:hypothetical protein [Caballeronia sp. KNU42]